LPTPFQRFLAISAASKTSSYAKQRYKIWLCSAT
jgi:hypothetical protein